MFQIITFTPVLQVFSPLPETISTRVFTTFTRVFTTLQNNLTHVSTMYNTPQNSSFVHALFHLNKNEILMFLN